MSLTPQQVEALIFAKNYATAHKREFAPEWYDWQMDFFADPAKQTMLMAGNQTGKTLCSGFKFACHVTGDYPDYWPGPKFRFGLNTTVGGVDTTQLKDVVQKILFGDVDESGSQKRFTGGWIHPGEIEDIEWSPQVRNLAQKVRVRSKHGHSDIRLRQYTQSRTGSGTLSFAGTVQDLIWIDECPPDSLVGQLVTRTINGMRGSGGYIQYSMTPELGTTELVTNFMEDLKPGQSLHGPISWDQCPHLTEEQQALVLAGVPQHEHEMRREGTPFFGAGLIYPIPEDRIKIPPFNYEEMHWFRVLRAIDLGVNHPQATAWLMYDIDQDTVYLVKDYSRKGQGAAEHVAATQTLWSHSPVVVPHDFDTTEKGTAEQVSKYYKKSSTNPNGFTTTIPFENPGGGNKVEPGILNLQDRMIDGRFKAFSTCSHFFREKRLYHRDEKGQRVKENDDVLDCVRQGTSMIPTKGVLLQPRIRKPRVRRAMAE